jgi:hypothetical protein
LSTNLTELERVDLGSGRPPRRGLTKLLLFLVSLVISAAAFLAFDWIYSSALQRATDSTLKPNLCRVPDPIRHHALKPDCTSTVGWGRDTYQIFTNSLGFRDQKIRAVPLADPRPRILLLGDSFTEGELAWPDSYAGRIAAHFPQYDLLNGGVAAYSASNYLNVVRMLLAAGYDIDDVIIFIDMADVHFEAAFYRDVDSSGAVTGPRREYRITPWYTKLRLYIASHLLVTDDVLAFIERQLVGLGYYNAVNATDEEWAAWTYRKVDETDPFPAGYAPLGVEGGLAKEMVKMNLLWQELGKRGIPISVVVYPYPGQIIHDSADSRQVRIWRQWCEGKCRRFISLFPAFLAVKDQCPRLQPGCWYPKLFIFGDRHFSSAGNDLVAETVIRSLTEEPPAKHPRRAASGTPQSSTSQ